MLGRTVPAISLILPKGSAFWTSVKGKYPFEIPSLFAGTVRPNEKLSRKLCSLRVDVYKRQIIDYDNKSGYFKLKNGEYMDITKIVCKDLLSATNDDINFDLFNWTKFYKTYSADIKLIGINLPTDTRTQQQYIQHKRCV